MSLRLSVSPAHYNSSESAVVVAIPIILLAANVTITNAQQQQQQPPSFTSQPAVTQNGTTLFQSIEDGVKMTVPEGWVIQDVNNTGSALLEETTKGYGILAQLCPEKEEQQQEGGEHLLMLTAVAAIMQPVAKDLKETSSYTLFDILTWTLDSKWLITPLLLLLLLPTITAT